MKIATILALALLPSCIALADNSFKTVVLPADTEIHLELVETISSQTAKVGETVLFRTVGDTTLDGILVIPDGTEADGVVLDAKRKGHFGHAGHLDIGIQFLRLAHGIHVPLDGATDMDGQDHSTRTALATGTAAVLFWPSAPFFLLMHGADVVLTGGTPVTAYVDHATTVPFPAN